MVSPAPVVLSTVTVGAAAKKYRFPGGQQRPLRPQGNHHLSYPAVQQLPGRFRQGFSGCQAVAVQGLQLLPVGFLCSPASL